MRWVISLLLVAYLGLAQALSSSGNRLLVVLEDLSDKGLYSKFFDDLEGKFRTVVLGLDRARTDFVAARNFQLTFESPKTESLSLFRHGALAYDHLILPPPKSKGRTTLSLAQFISLLFTQATVQHSLRNNSSISSTSAGMFFLPSLPRLLPRLPSPPSYLSSTYRSLQIAPPSLSTTSTMIPSPLPNSTTSCSYPALALCDRMSKTSSVAMAYLHSQGQSGRSSATPAHYLHQS